MTVRVTDNGAAALLERLRAGRITIDVGIVGEDAHTPRENGITNAELGLIHELGLGVPQRSWLRGFFAERKAQVDEAARRVTRKIISDPSYDPTKAASALGAWLVGQIQERISRHIAPPNAPSTVRRKGSSTPLIDTNAFRSAITYRVKK